MAEQIYVYLFNLILSRKLAPGDRIQEMAIAKEFNVSRTPVREALRDLAKDGIITIYPSRYSEVAEFDEQKVKDIGLAKIFFDRQALKLAGYYGSRADYARLREIAETCYQEAKKGHRAESIKADSDFHWKLCRIGKNSALISLEKQIMIQVEYLQAARYLDAENPETQYESHIHIVEALERGDIEAGLRYITEPNLKFYNLTDLPSKIYE